MKILHTSDWHLGQHFYGKSRIHEHQSFLNWLLEQAVERDIDAIVVAGDIFDTGTPPSYAREMYFDFISKISKINCQLIVLAGNHDSVAMLGESKSLVKSLSTRVIPAVTENIEEQVFILNNKNGEAGAVVCAIPFIRPRDIVKSSAGQSASQKQQSLQQAISEHYHHLFDKAKTLSNNELPVIATGHLTTVGVTATESVRDIYIGTLDAFPANAFPDADYIALGHIHRAQKVAKTEHIRYSGSPIPLSFDEAKQRKVVMLVEFNLQKNTNQETSDKPLIDDSTRESATADMFETEASENDFSLFSACVSEVEIPCFQPLVSLKTNLDNLSNDIAPYLQSVGIEQQKIWLDIEIDSGEYLQDLTARIETLVEDHPVEILLVRRSKKARESMPSHQKKITLNELSLDEVFESRLSLESWDGDEQIERKSRITQLFQESAIDAKEEIVKKGVAVEEKAQ